MGLCAAGGCGEREDVLSQVDLGKRREEMVPAARLPHPERACGERDSGPFSSAWPAC